MRDVLVCNSEKPVAKNTEYMRLYMARRRAARRAAAIAQLGGRCKRCGKTNTLEFDHKIRSSKSFALGGADRDWTQELKKCQLLCKSCHTKKTNMELYGREVGLFRAKTPDGLAYRRDLMRRWREKKSQR